MGHQGLLQGNGLHPARAPAAAPAAVQERTVQSVTLPDSQTPPVTATSNDGNVSHYSNLVCQAHGAEQAEVTIHSINGILGKDSVSEF